MRTQRSFAVLIAVTFGGVALAGCFHEGATTDDNVIKIGTLFPITGDLAAFGPDMQKGAELAAENINAAGGVLGKQVKIVHGDDHTSATQAPQEMNRLVDQERVVAVVGAAASGVTVAVMPKAKSASVPVISPASTSPTLAKQDVTGGWFFRVPPSDALQGRVMAQLLQEDLVAVKVNSIYVNNDYGKGFNDVMRSALPTGALGTGVEYASDATTFTSEVTQVCSGAPSAIVLIGYPETGSSIMKRAQEVGCTDTEKWYFSEGVKDQKFVYLTGNKTGGGYITAGFKGTSPAGGPTNTALTEFKAAFKAKHNKDPGLFAVESYDAVVWVALAMQKAGGSTGAQIRDNINTVVNFNAGDTNATKVKDALDAIKANKAINWDGPASSFDLDNNHEPVHGYYQYWRVKTDGTIEVTKDNIFI